MHKLTHYRVCPASRAARLLLAELAIPHALAEELPWTWRAEFLAINPAGELPVLELQGGAILCGIYAISEYVAEEARALTGEVRTVPVLPGTREDRAEARRLVDWFQHKLGREVTQWILAEKLYGPQQSAAHAPNVETLRAARANLRYHMGYISYLAYQRRWLAGEQLSFADLMAGAQLSCLDYLGEVPWEGYQPAKEWYARIKSRPSFRSLLSDRVPGMPPPVHYTDLDF
ncbi:MAG: glutathione S-transferase family protein [Hyphomicrobiaceae bacterium]|nr:glutathione S-transferase family protein [Hyphomicrobiaceae bacterium]